MQSYHANRIHVAPLLLSRDDNWAFAPILRMGIKKKKISAHSGGEMEVFFMVSGDVEEEKCVTYNLYRSLSSIFRQNILKWNASQNVLFWIV